MAVFTEDDPRSPQPARHPGAYTPGDLGADRSAEYGGPPMRGGIVSFTPMRHPAADGRAGDDIAVPSLGDIIGHMPSIGVTLP